MSAISPLSGSLGRRGANHLLKRLTFGPTNKQIKEFEHKSIDQALDILLKEYAHPVPPVDPKTGKQWVNPAPKEIGDGRVNSWENQLIPYLRYWWFNVMCKEQSGIIEKMVFFYHSHFTTIQSRIRYSLSLYHQLSLFRHHALGNVKELARKMCIDNAMLIHLDGNNNEHLQPNENFAREFLELYTIGKGKQVSSTDYTNYTEHDVKEASRILSGFKTEHSFSEHIDPETGVPLGRVLTNPLDLAIRHDKGTKKFSHRFGYRVIEPKEIKPYFSNGTYATREAALQEITDLVDMIFEQKETARHFCRKLYRFFVYYNITDDIEWNIIEPMADTLYRNNYEMLPVLRQLFSSQHFFGKDNNISQDDVRASLIKSPLDLVCGTLRYFKMELPDVKDTTPFYAFSEKFLEMMANQGMELYEPYEVAGYSAYHQAPSYNRNWISSNTLVYRYQFPQTLLNGVKGEGYTWKLDLMDYVNNNISNPADAVAMARELVEDLLPEAISEERFSYFLNDILLDNLSPINWEHEWRHYESGGSDAAVKPQIEKLLVAIMQSPEYQLV